MEHEGDVLSAEQHTEMKGQRRGFCPFSPLWSIVMQDKDPSPVSAGTLAAKAFPRASLLVPGLTEYSKIV